MENFDLKVEKTEGLWIITSATPEIKGLLVAERSLAAALTKLPEAIYALRAAQTVVG